MSASDVRHYSKQFITEFLELYQSLPALWKIKCKDYLDRNKKQQSYEKIVEKLREIEPNADREIVTKKINSLRSSYRKEKKKIADSQKSGAGAEEVYVPNLWYFDLLRFVDDQEIVRAPVSNLEEVFLQDDINADSMNSASVEPEYDLPSIPQSSVPSTNSSVTPRRGRPQAAKKQTEINSMIAAVGQRLCEAHDDDRYDTFGCNVATFIHTFDPTT